MMKRYAVCVLKVLAVLLIPVPVELILNLCFGLMGIDPLAFALQHVSLHLLLSQTGWMSAAGVWYYLGFFRNRRTEGGKSLLTVRYLPVLLLLSLSFYFLVASGLYWAQVLLPDAMKTYGILIEDSQIAGLTALSTVSTLILAPIAEELMFRGLIFRYLKRTGIGFAAANLMQAVLFGLYHMNWIQGSYAFLLGLMLGYVGGKYRTLTASVLLHGCFNFFGTYLAAALVVLPETGSAYGGIAAAGLLLFSASMYMMQKELS